MHSLSPLSPPKVVLRWPRWLRIVVGAILTTATLASIPFLMLGIRQVAGLDACGDSSIAATAWRCGMPGRMVLAVAIVAICGYPMIYWARILQGMISWKAPALGLLPDVITVAHELLPSPSRSKPLKLGQFFVEGILGRPDDSRFQARVAGRSFSLLNLAGFSSGYLRIGDPVQFVVQTIPMAPGLALGLAFRSSSSGGARGVAVGTSTWAVLTSMVALVYLLGASPRYSLIFAITAALVLAFNLAILVLSILALRALQAESHD